MLINSLLFTLVALASLTAAGFSKRYRKLILTAIFINLTCVLIYLFVDHYSHAGVNYATLEHLVPLLTPATVVQFWPSILLFLGSLITISITLKIISRAIVSGNITASRFTSKLACFSAPVFIVVAYLANPLFHDSYELYKGISQDKELDPLPNGFDDITKLAPAIEYTAPQQKKNFIIILAESFNGSFTDANLYPGLTPGITQLIDERGTQFTGIKELRLSDWTISGLVALFCGVSMYPDITETKVSEEEKDSAFVQRRMAAANIIGESCIGDVLAQDGYELSFTGGSEFGIVGKTRLFESQGINKLYLTNEIAQASTEELPRSSWGIYDDDLFNFSEKLLSKEQSLPFGFVTLTVDTHEPYEISPTCNNKTYGEGEQEILNAIHCSDKLISNFINTILNSPKHQDTTIILLSDHLYRGVLQDSPIPRREIDYLFAVFNHELRLQGQKTIHREATPYDIGPTILGLLGYNINTFNFGRNLLNEEPTLAESLTWPQVYEYVIYIRHKMRDYWLENFEQEKGTATNN